MPVPGTTIADPKSLKMLLMNEQALPCLSTTLMYTVSLPPCTCP
jgi:hypothetical protein